MCSAAYQKARSDSLMIHFTRFLPSVLTPTSDRSEAFLASRAEEKKGRRYKEKNRTDRYLELSVAAPKASSSQALAQGANCP